MISKHVQQFKQIYAGGLAVLLGIFAVGDWDVASADQSTTHAKTQVVNELDFNTVQLSNAQMQHLGVTMVPVVREQVQVTESYGAEVIIPPGNSTQILAPVAGRLIVLNSKAFQAGKPVKENQVIFQIQPILSADAQVSLQNALVDAKSALSTAQTQQSAAKVRMERAQQLLENLVGSQKNVEDATEAYEVAQKTLTAAEARSQALAESSQQGAGQRISVRLPNGGEITNLFAMANQVVAAGSPIVAVGQTNRLWVKVPVPLTDLNNIDQHAPARVQAMSAASASGTVAKPVNAPLSADPLTGATFRYYELNNADRRFSPAQRVMATLSTQQTEDEALIVPWSAVVFDVYGGSWVYVKAAENVFKRQRVFVDRVINDHAVLRHGPTEGSLVVSQGALELLGVETGVSH